MCGPRTIPGVGDIQLFSKDKMLCVPFFCHFLSPSTGSKKVIQYGGLAGGISIHSAAASTYVQCPCSLLAYVSCCDLHNAFYVYLLHCVISITYLSIGLTCLSQLTNLYPSLPFSLLLNFPLFIYSLTPHSNIHIS